MEIGIKFKLLEIKKNATVVKTISSYIDVLSEMFIKDISLFNAVCENYGFSSEDLLALLENDDLKNIPLLDELVQFCNVILKQKTTENPEIRR